ncbi:MAG: hypothetical protein ACI9MC_000654 [Kiritimatiellia bacterium]|jgi:hypothetical protein
MFESTFSIDTHRDRCTFTSNSIPNHDFGDGRDYHTPVRRVATRHPVPSKPEAARLPTALGLRVDNAVFLNGVKLDALSAACYGIGHDRLGHEKIGCFRAGTPWRYDPMHTDNQRGEGALPAGTYDGTFVDDYAFTGSGDLGACNGMTRDGVDGFYVTDSYPWVLGCFTGTPDPSFHKHR